MSDPIEDKEWRECRILVASRLRRIADMEEDIQNLQMGQFKLLVFGSLGGMVAGFLLQVLLKIL